MQQAGQEAKSKSNNIFQIQNKHYHTKKIVFNLYNAILKFLYSPRLSLIFPVDCIKNDFYLNITIHLDINNK